MFQHISRLNPDAILGLMAKFRSDTSSDKVDLGVGVFRDLTGNTPILTCVLRAEQLVLSAQTTKSYVAAAGREEFNTAVEELVLGAEHPARIAHRVRTVQAPGGSGALRVGAELIRAAAPQVTVHVSDPTWANHIPLLGSSGLRLQSYPYYDLASHTLRFDAMLERLNEAAAGDVVLIHACCHNPTGADLTFAQWQALVDLLQRRQLIPYIDLAYLGFAEDLNADAEGLRLVARSLPEALIAVSFSKNLGLYRERVGALIVISENASRADAVRSQMLQIGRSLYSMPPDHGAAIAACIFADPKLRELWITELAAMRNRIIEMRALLAKHLRSATQGDSFDFLADQRGMFSLLGVGPSVVEILRERHHIFMLDDGRVNLAGIMPHNVAYVADAIAAEREP